jgi:sarcosine oxidase
MRTDIIVVGTGAMGAAVLYQLARAGASVLGIDRHTPPHDRGSSHGDSRITRQAIGEGAAYVPLVRRSHEIWRELERETGESLLLQTGGLILAAADGAANHHGAGDFVQATAAVARATGIAHEMLEAGEITRRYPHFALTGDEIGYFEPGAGLVRPERCIAAQLAMAQRHGAVLRCGEIVASVVPDGSGVCVTTDQGVYRAGRAVMAAGAWMPTLLAPKLARSLRITRQMLHWFTPSNPELWAAENSPVFMWMHGPHEEDYMYGFPILPGSEGVKVASEQYASVTTADTIDRDVTPAESRALFHRHVAGRLVGLQPDRLRAAACLYTVTPDRAFVVGPHPDHGQITLVSACSGHGFKHSAGLGEAVAQSILTGHSAADLTAFAAGRLLATASA